MTQLQLLQAMGYAQDAHILDANEEPVKKRVIPLKKIPKSVIRSIAAVLAVVLAVSLFLQTPMGVAAAEVVKEQFERLLDVLFPPKEAVMYVEGVPQTVHVEAMGREPEADSPGFSIYVDTERYTMTEENGSWFIRPIPVQRSREEIRQEEAAILEGLSPEEQESAIDRRIQELEEFYASLPPTEMEIREFPDQTPAEAAEMVREAMEGKWKTLSEVSGYGQPETLRFHASQGNAWNAAWEGHDFKSNGEGGCYQIVRRGYLEASEGHGQRFYQMLETFTLVAPQDTSVYTDKDTALLEAIRQEMAYAQEQDAQLLEKANNAENQADMNIAAYEREALWLDVHGKLWTALEQSLTEGDFYNLRVEELEWTTQKKQELDKIREELDGGSLTGAAVSGQSAVSIRERVMTLLAYLKGTVSIPAQVPDLVLSPETVVKGFAAAYFNEDLSAMKPYLSENYSGEVEAFSTGKEVVNAIKGLEDVHKSMIHYGWLSASVEYRATQASDSYSYLSITLVWENDRWAVEFYGLEG